MATEDSYWKAFSDYRSRDNYSEVFSATLSKLSSELDLTAVKSCLMIGAGDGQHELQIIKQFAVNTSKIVAVEPDHESAERLRARLEKSLPGVDSQVMETNIQSWKGPDDPVDLVLMMLFLHNISTSERKELLKNLHEQWLTEGGYAVVMSPSRTKCPGSPRLILERLGRTMTAWGDIKADILEAGFVMQRAREMQCVRDFSNLSESVLRFYQRHVEQPVTLDDIRSVIEELFPTGKTDQLFYMFAVFRKA